MQDEIVEVVDKDCTILRRVEKQVAHKEGLLHKTVIATIINSAGKRMLVRPYSHRQDAGQFVSPVGGHVTAGETDDEALKREVMEEVGLEGFKYKLKGKGIFDRWVLGRHENHYFILYEVFTDQKPVLGDEAKSLKWFTDEELKYELKKHPKDFGDAFYFVYKSFYPELLS